MRDTKQLADLITGSRLLLALGYLWLGLSRGAAALPAAGWLLLVNWTGDSVDGALARRSRVTYHTWIGDHDLEVDMLVAAGLLAFLVTAGFLPASWGLLYLLLCFAVFALVGVQRSLGMLVQAPVYGFFIAVSLRHAPVSGWALVLWVAGALIITWPRFPREIVPNFLHGIRDLADEEKHPTHHPRPDS